MADVLIASRLLGWAIFVGSVLIKVPQIVAFVSSRSVDGISAAYVNAELTSYIFCVCYHVLKGNPLQTWGELLNICVQNAIILALFYHLSGGLGARALASFCFHLATIVILLNDMLPDVRLPRAACEPLTAFIPYACGVLTGRQVMAAVPSIFMVASRAPQLWLNFRQRHTGQLSLVTCSLFAVGVLARLFTTVTEINDPVLVCGLLISLLMNGALALQIMFYRKATAKVAAERHAEAHRSRGLGGNYAPNFKFGDDETKKRVL